jgi:hypothetical protein
MRDSGIKLLKLMFKEGEYVCVSHNKYGYMSIPLELAMSNNVPIIPPVSGRDIEFVTSDELKLVALNPFHKDSPRQDAGCCAFRNFLVEIDVGTPKEQLEYVKRTALPYSAAVFSGNKSIHFLISLEEDLPNEKIYRMFAEWILAVITLADQNCKNPSRSIRIPGNWREPGKMQVLVEYHGKVKTKDLADWLMKYPDLKPKERERRKASDNPDISKVASWAAYRLKEGVNSNRNKTWFAIACEFCLAGYSEDDTIDILTNYFVESHDFKEKEWLTSLNSAFKYIQSRG